MLVSTLECETVSNFVSTNSIFVHHLYFVQTWDSVKVEIIELVILINHFTEILSWVLNHIAQISAIIYVGLFMCAIVATNFT